MTDRGIRTLRGTATAVLAVFVAALFHDAAGDGLPSVLAVVLSLAFATPICVVLAGRRIVLWRQAACVGISQLALHLLFSLGSDASGTSLNVPAGHLHAGMHIDVVAGHGMAMHGGTGWMVLAHTAAAIVTLIALRYGERTLYALANFTVLLVTAIRRLTVTPVPAPVRMGVQTRPVTLASPTRVLGAMRHRGPPALSVAA
ncbi:hypothetical protein [Humibacter albus]|uniref:hypothetical protein n=1 Tax=Humibacter albus TaxID=427754 RepID=UPI0003B465AC|nr:hypothetical protein [Humibacter albus]